MADKPFIISKDLQVGDGSAAGTTDALLRVDDTNNRVGINTPTPTGTLDVTVASSGDRGLIVRSVSSQTTRSFEILGANGSGVFSIDPSGSVYFSPWSGTQTSSIRYDAPTNGLVFTGSGTSANPIELNVLSDSTLSFEGTAGQLFSVADGLSSGTIFAVSDISGMPSLEIDASGLIKLGEFDGFVGVGTSQTYGQYSGKMEINYPSGYKGLLVRPGSAEIRNAIEVQNSSSGTVFSVDPYGATVIDLTTSTTSKGLIIQAATSQAANLQEWQNASSTVLASVNQEGRFSGVSYNASSGVILQAATPASTTNTLYNVGGSLYFNGSAVGGSISTLTFGSGLSGSTSSTFDGTSAVTVNFGGTGTLTQLNFPNDVYIYAPDSIYIGYEAGKDIISDGINIGIGYTAIGNDGTQAPSGSANIGIGWGAGNGQRGEGNVYIGSFAGLYNVGSNNLEIIQGAGYDTSIIGNNAVAFSNKLNLGSVIVGDTSTKRLAIGNVGTGNLSPNSTIEILPSGASTKSLILKGTAAYATNFLEVQNSSSTANLYIDQNYNLVTTGNVTANTGVYNVLDLTPIPDTNYPTHQEGLVFYDDENKSLTVYNDEADISLQVGQEMYLRVRNDSGSGILNGQLVYVSGSQGTHPQVGLAIANCVYKSQAVGMATHDIEDNSFGYVTSYGIVRGLDTSGYGSGLPVYLSPTVSGGYTLTAPEPPYFNVHVGHVIRGGSASNGSILIEMESPKFAGLDVTTTSGNINISGVPFYSVSGCAGVAMVTDPTFYYSSGNQTLFLNNIDAPTGIIDKIVFGSGSLAFTDGGGGVVLTSLQHSSGSYLQTTLGQGSYTYTNVYLKDSPSDQSYAWGGWATTTTESNLAWNYSSNFGAGLYYGRSIKINGTDITLESATAGGATLPTKVWTTNSVLTQGYSDTRYAVTSGVVAATTASPGYLNTLLNANISGVAYRIPMLPSGATNVALSGNIGINTTSPGASLEVDALSSATKGVIVKGAVSQAANLLELQNSSSTNLLYANTTGVLTTLPVYAYGTNNGGWAMEVKNTANFSYGLLIKNNNDTYPPYTHFAIQKSAGTNMFTILDNSIGTYNTNINFNGGYAHTYSGGTNLTYGSSAGRRFASTNAANNIFYGFWAGGSSDGGASATSNAINNFVHGYYSFGYYTATGTLDSNFIFGYTSCVNIKYGSHNFSFGAASFPLQVGSYNINLGQAGMGSLATGNYNISIGQGTVFPATCDYSIALGRAATVDKSNQLVIGSTSYKIGRSSAGESGVSSTTPSGISHLLEAKINGAYYQIPLLPSGATNLYIPPALSGGASGYIPIWDSASSLTYDSSLAYSTSGKYFTYTGTGVSANPMKMKILDDSTLSFESTDGQLFSISDGLQSGRIFAVNDISGMPFIEVDASGLVKIAEYDGVMGIGTSQTYGQYSGKVEITYPSGLGGLISRPASGAPGNALEVQTFSSGTVFTVSQSGTISSTLQGQTAKGLVVKAGTSQTANLLELQDAGGTPVLTISPSGSISGAISPGIIQVSSSTYTLTDGNHGQIVEYTGTSGSGTFTIGSITIPSWNCMLVNIESGVIVAPGSNTLLSPGSASGTRTRYSSLSLYRRSSTTSFVLAGDLA